MTIVNTTRTETLETMLADAFRQAIIVEALLHATTDLKLNDERKSETVGMYRKVGAR